MQITKEMLLQKKDELLQRREELLGEANVCNGALQNIDYWLEVIDQPAIATSPVAANPLVVVGNSPITTSGDIPSDGGGVLTFPALGA